MQQAWRAWHPPPPKGILGVRQPRHPGQVERRRDMARGTRVGTGVGGTPLKGFRTFLAMWLSSGAQEARNQVWQQREGQKDWGQGLR